MRTKTAMLASAAAVALASGVVLAPAAMADPIPPAASYADLLEPVPDAMARIRADDATGYGDAHVIPAQLNIGINLHHHHHHHHHSARWYRGHGFWWNGRVWVQGPPPPPVYVHHHHHHSAYWYRSHGFFWDGRVWIPRPAYHHHHHHHHHHWR